MKGLFQAMSVWSSFSLLGTNFNCSTNYIRGSFLVIGRSLLHLFHWCPLFGMAGVYLSILFAFHKDISFILVSIFSPLCFISASQAYPLHHVPSFLCWQFCCLLPLMLALILQWHYLIPWTVILELPVLLHFVLVFTFYCARESVFKMEFCFQ